MEKIIIIIICIKSILKNVVVHNIYLPIIKKKINCKKWIVVHNT